MNGFLLSEAVVCFTVASQAAEIVKALGGETATLHSVENPIRYKKQLQSIDSLTKTWPSPCEDVEGLLFEDFQCSSIRIPSNLDDTDSTILHIQSTAFCVASSTATTTRTAIKFVPFAQIQDARRRVNKIRSLSIPIILAVLDIRPNAELPQCVPAHYQTRNDGDTKSAFSFRFRGLPKGFTAFHHNVDLWRQNTPPEHHFATALKRDDGGAIYFVSSAFITHSLFFGCMSEISDFLLSPITMTLIHEPCDIISAIIEKAAGGNSAIPGRDPPEEYSSDNSRNSGKKRLRCSSTEYKTRDTTLSDHEYARCAIETLKTSAMKTRVQQALESFKSADRSWCKNVAPDSFFMNCDTYQNETPNRTPCQLVSSEHLRPNHSPCPSYHFTFDELQHILKGAMTEKSVLEKTIPESILSLPIIPLNRSMPLSYELADAYLGREYYEQNTVDRDICNNSIFECGKSIASAQFQKHFFPGDSDTDVLDERFRAALVRQVFHSKKSELFHLLRLAGHQKPFTEHLTLQPQLTSSKTLPLFESFWDEVASQVEALSFASSGHQKPLSGREALVLFINSSDPRDGIEMEKQITEPEWEETQLMKYWKSHVSFLLLHGSSSSEMLEDHAAVRTASDEKTLERCTTHCTLYNRAVLKFRRELSLARALWAYSLSLNECMVIAQSIFLRKLEEQTSSL